MSPDPRLRGLTVRGSQADEISAARFDVDLRAGVPVDPELTDAVRLAAQTAGYAEGWAQGQRAARAVATATIEQVEAAERTRQAARSSALDQAVAAIAGAATRLEQRLAQSAQDVEELIVENAVDLAEALIGRELSNVGQRATDAARRAMSLAPTGLAVAVRLHPDDHRTLIGAAGLDGYEFEGRPVHLIADADLEPGDAIAECGATTIDASLAAARARVRDLLASPGGAGDPDETAIINDQGTDLA